MSTTESFASKLKSAIETDLMEGETVFIYHIESQIWVNVSSYIDIPISSWNGNVV